MEHNEKAGLLRGYFLLFALKWLRKAGADVRSTWGYEAVEQYVRACVRQDVKRGLIRPAPEYATETQSLLVESLPADLRPGVTVVQEIAKSVCAQEHTYLPRSSA